MNIPEVIVAGCAVLTLGGSVVGLVQQVKILQAIAKVKDWVGNEFAREPMCKQRFEQLEGRLDRAKI